MSRKLSLHDFLCDSAKNHPNATAVVDAIGSLTYQEFSELSNRVRDRLWQLGVRPGDRVGTIQHKSIDSLASIFGILKTGAAYVPVDLDAPAERGAFILNDCSVKAVLADACCVDKLQSEMQTLGSDPPLIAIEGFGGGTPLSDALEIAAKSDPPPIVETVQTNADDLAYILYTSGSTGKPKGVMLTHENAASFVDWCSEVFEPTTDDRFSSHAPFHFDLSILDIYVPIKHAATLVLIGEEVSKEPAKLAPLIQDAGITIWYSTPSVLSLLTQYGNMSKYDYSALRMVLFAGEVFPLKHLEALKELIPAPRYFNLYGPTETNVCTYYEVPDVIPKDRTEPFPIGRACSHAKTRVLDENDKDVATGAEGELCVGGPSVTHGYWNLPGNTERAFVAGTNDDPWYKTGDIVIEDSAGDYLFVGRRDRMVKKRGYRVELGEIENALYRHPQIEEAAVIATLDEDNGVRVKAFVNWREGRPSVIALKKFCVDHLPAYMAPDIFSFLDSLPKTSTDKIDYQRLKEMD